MIGLRDWRIPSGVEKRKSCVNAQSPQLKIDMRSFSYLLLLFLVIWIFWLGEFHTVRFNYLFRCSLQSLTTSRLATSNRKLFAQWQKQKQNNNIIITVDLTKFLFCRFRCAQLRSSVTLQKHGTTPEPLASRIARNSLLVSPQSMPD